MAISATYCRVAASGKVSSRISSVMRSPPVVVGWWPLGVGWVRCLSVLSSFGGGAWAWWWGEILN